MTLMKADFDLKIRGMGIALEKATKALRRGLKLKKSSNRSTTKKIQKGFKKIKKDNKS
jgi:hypothetical protein